MADGQAIGTKTETIDAIPGGTTFAYGGVLNFPSAAPVVRLEVVVKVGGRQRHVIRQPLVQSIGIAPGLRDAMWVGEVNGEIVNDHPSLNVEPHEALDGRVRRQRGHRRRRQRLRSRTAPPGHAGGVHDQFRRRRDSVGAGCASRRQYFRDLHAVAAAQRRPGGPHTSSMLCQGPTDETVESWFGGEARKGDGMTGGQLLIAFTLGAAALALWSYVRWPGAAPATMTGAVLRMLIAFALLGVGLSVLDTASVPLRSWRSSSWSARSCRS